MLRVLVVDDDDDIRQWLVTVLKSNGYSVTDMAHGDEVVSALRVDDVDLALVDYHLPGKDGLTLLRHIRDANISVPVVILTADASQAVAVECFRNGAADFIAKPIDPDYLAIVVDRAIQAHSRNLKNIAYRTLGYVHHREGCAHFDNPQECNCGLAEMINSIRGF